MKTYTRGTSKVAAFVTRNRRRLDGTLVAPYAVKAYTQPAQVMRCRRVRQFCPACSYWPKWCRRFCWGCGGAEKVPYKERGDE